MDFLAHIDLNLFVIGVAILVFAVLVGVLVNGVLARRAEALAVAGDDEILARVAARNAGPFAGLSRNRRAEQVRHELPDALDMVSNSLTAGLTLPQALMRNLEHFPPQVQDEFAHVIYDTRLGFSVADAFDNLAERLKIKDVRMVAIASKIGVAHGGNLAESYRMLSTLLRDGLAFEEELRAMTTEGRMQALVMTALPFVLMLLLALVRLELVLPMVTTVAGWCTLGVLCGMQAVAYVWIRKIVDIKV